MSLDVLLDKIQQLCQVQPTEVVEAAADAEADLVEAAVEPEEAEAAVEPEVRVNVSLNEEVLVCFDQHHLIPTGGGTHAGCGGANHL